MGNGFDRKLGLNTDYLSFLDWLKEKGEGVGEDFRKASGSLINTHYFGNVGRLKSFVVNPEVISLLSGNRFKLKNHPSTNYFDEVTETKFANKLLYLLPDIVEKSEGQKSVAPGIWYTFIQLLLFEKKEKILKLDTSKFAPYLGDEGNWIDIEGLIRRNIETRTLKDYFRDGAFSISSHFDVFSLANLLIKDIETPFYETREKIYEIVWEDFLNFKKQLCTYLSETSSKMIELWPRYEAEIQKHKLSKEYEVFNIDNFDKIINFNYTNFLPKKSVVYHVHGSIEDSSDIVFGLDMNVKDGELDMHERKTKFEIALSKNKKLLRFSKISQLLNLQIDKPSNTIGVITSLYIVGHSISEQDYGYYFSILDRSVDQIVIKCWWYKYNNGGDNKQATKESLFEMLNSYERYSNRKILHAMIFEGRIKFNEVYLPRLI